MPRRSPIQTVALGRFLAFAGLRPADVQVQDVAVGVIVGMIKPQGIDSSEIISTVNGRPSLTISANAGLQIRR